MASIPPVSEQEVRAAWAVVDPFLRTLERADYADDARLLDGMTPDARAHFDRIDAVRVSGLTYIPPIAWKVRQVMGLEAATVPLLQLLATVHLFPGPVCRFRYMPGVPVGGVTVGGEPSWHLDLESHDGRWLVDPRGLDRGPMVGTAIIGRPEAPPARS